MQSLKPVWRWLASLAIAVCALGLFFVFSEHETTTGAVKGLDTWRTGWAILVPGAIVLIVAIFFGRRR